MGLAYALELDISINTRSQRYNLARAANDDLGLHKVTRRQIQRFFA